jgi:hypothetical protein
MKSAGRITLTLCAVVVASGCGGGNGTETISDSVIGSLACYSSSDTWYNYLTSRDQGLNAHDDTDAAAMVLPGDRVQLLEQHNVDEHPGLVGDTGSVDKVKILTGVGEGKTCWLFSGSNPNGPLYQ